MTNPLPLTDSLVLLAASGRPVTLAYHPDADPGDGSGWVLEIGDRTWYGMTLEDVAAQLADEAGKL